MSKKRKKSKPSGSSKREQILEDIRQLQFPSEFRIHDTGATEPEDVTLSDAQAGERAEATTSQHTEPPTHPDPTSSRLIAEMATLLWYLKTKHFRRDWDDPETGDDDPRIRRALSRIGKGIEALKQSGIEVYDPTHQRYPQGGEAMMRPIQLLPTTGITYEIVNETVTPVVFAQNRLIQRGEVFVAVPMDSAPDTDPSNQIPDAAES